MKDEILIVRGLSAGYWGKGVLSEISFELKQGEILGIAGESGSGKSTLLKSVFPMSEPGFIKSQGEILYKGREFKTFTKEELRKLKGEEIGLIGQNPKASFNPNRTFLKQFMETLKSHGLYQKETFLDHVKEVFDQLNLSGGEELLNSYPRQMSGGMNQRIAIALSVLLKPSLLLADEPTSALDAVSQELVLKELLKIREYYGTSIVLVSHNLGVISKIADQAAVMHQGTLVEYGDAKEVFYTPRHSYTKSLIGAVPGIRLSENKAPKTTSDCLLEVTQLRRNYKRNERMICALNGISLKLKPGEIMGIVGESGSGKTTLLKQIAGVEKPEVGTIAFLGKKCSVQRTREELSRMQLIFQNAADSFDPRRKIRHSMEEILINLLKIKSKTERKERIHSQFLRVGLSPELLERYPWELSGGQCQRAAIARALCVNPMLLLCDEITSALDVLVQSELTRLLESLARERKMAVLFVSHDISLVSRFCDTVMVMKEGACVEAASVKEILEKPKSGYTKQLLAAAGIDRSLNIEKGRRTCERLLDVTCQ